MPGYGVSMYCMIEKYQALANSYSLNLLIPLGPPPDNQEVLSNMILDGSSFGTGFLCWPRSIEVCSLMIPSSVKAGAAT